MFEEVKRKMQARFTEISKTGQLFYVAVDRDKVWDTYLNAFEEEFQQGNRCNCCKSFLRQYGGVVGIKDNKIVTLWDFEVESPEYAKSIKALRAYVVSLPIAGIFLNPFPKCGTDKNPDKPRGVVWNHFYIELPSSCVKRDIGPAQGAALDNKNVLQRSLNEITDDAVATVLELIGQNSLYRGQEFKGMLTAFQAIREQYKKVKGAVLKNNFCWTESGKTSQAVTRIRNSSIGTLLNDLSGGRELDGAVAAFERVVAPANYKRPTALVTPKMIEKARERLEELGLTGSLYRRMLSNKDLTVDNALFVHRNNAGGDIFDQLKREVTVNPKTLSKVEEISIQDFIDKVVPTAKSIKLLLENRHAGNFVSLVGPKNKGDNTMFKWGNNYSWSYSGEVTDSIKERVKAAGGKVDGVLRVSLSWNNKDDLDLHLIEPGGYRTSYVTRGKKSPSGGTLDLDANGLSGMRSDPAENICWPNLPTVEGKYQIIINNYSRREASNQGYELEVEYQGEVFSFAGDNNGTSGQDLKKIDFTYSKKNGVSFAGQASTGVGQSSYNTKEVWGLKTGQFHTVKALTLSPNYWNSKIGNKHFMFFLDNCKTDGKVRGLYNEFLKEELAADRKVFELLGGKVEVEQTENELSGVGFSETVKSDVIVEVDGSFKRLLKIKF